MTITGTWDLPDLVASEGEYDFFALPPINPNLSPGLIGGVGRNFSIPASAKDPDAAAKVLDVIYSEEVQREIVEQVGNISPFIYDKEQWNLPALTREVVEILFNPDVTVGYNLSQVTPAGFVDEYYAATQGLTIGELTPEDFTTRLQTAWQEHNSQEP
jgi:ABC-type glycerol-3-phosphate transport system substrate-binding protein